MGLLWRCAENEIIAIKLKSWIVLNTLLIANMHILDIRCRAPIIFIEISVPGEIMKVQSTEIYSHLHNNIAVPCTLAETLAILFL